MRWTTGRETSIAEFNRLPNSAFRVLPESVVRGVPITDIVATQHMVGVEGVAQYLPRDVVDPLLDRGPVSRSGPLGAGWLPVLVEWKGRLLVSNGHHRIMAAILRGETTIDAHVIRLTPPTPEAFGFPDDMGPDPEALLDALPDIKDDYIQPMVDLTDVWPIQIEPPYPMGTRVLQQARYGRPGAVRLPVVTLTPEDVSRLVATQRGV